MTKDPMTKPTTSQAALIIAVPVAMLCGFVLYALYAKAEAVRLRNAFRVFHEGDPIPDGDVVVDPPPPRATPRMPFITEPTRVKKAIEGG